MLAQRLASGVAQEPIESEIRRKRFLAGLCILGGIEIIFSIQAHYLSHHPRVTRLCSEASSVWVIQILYQVILISNKRPRTTLVRLSIRSSQFV
jgi:hypothetical protein